MTFIDVPVGAALFLDANVLIYAIARHPVYGSACENLLDRIEHQHIRGFTSAHVLADVAHRLMTLEDLREVKTITIRRIELRQFSLRPGDVVLTEGGNLDKSGRGFIWNGEVSECVHQNHIFAVRPDLSRLSSEFIAYQTQSPYGKRYFLSVAHKTTNLASINTSKLKGFPVLVPPKEQQKEIVRRGGRGAGRLCKIHARQAFEDR